MQYVPDVEEARSPQHEIATRRSHPGPLQAIFQHIEEHVGRPLTSRSVTPTSDCSATNTQQGTRILAPPRQTLMALVVHLRPHVGICLLAEIDSPGLMPIDIDAAQVTAMRRLQALSSKGEGTESAASLTAATTAGTDGQR